ncbi:MAG: nucleotidyltransferase substrate binding protein [Deltaproteobacteria bacterium]|nr:nucleotidyltransferase substrate binding protein [Deltaproteobacteria bacterium]
MERLKERLALARRALSSLQELLLLAHPSRVERDAAIQRFEYTCEAIWKAAQRYLLEEEGINAGSPKGSIRACREVGLLSDDQTILGLEMIDDRNLTVHTYNEAVAEDIYSHLAQYGDLLVTWLAAMEARIQQ